VPDALPEELGALLSAADPAQFDAAWADFIASFSPLLLRVARSLTREHDAAMDTYAHLLEQLRADECRRLRSFTSDGRAKFTTWLVVVARRLGLDHQRQRYGRFRSRGDAPPRDEAAVRRRLEDLVAGPVQPDDLAVPAAGPDAVVEAAERARAVDAALTRLDERDRLLVSLRFADELSAREIADLLGFPSPFHVYRRLKVVLERLRGDLRGFGDGP